MLHITILALLILVIGISLFIHTLGVINGYEEEEYITESKHNNVDSHYRGFSGS